MSPTAQEELAQHLSYQVFDKDSYIFHMGDMGTKFYLVFQGRVGMYQPEKILGSRAWQKELAKNMKRSKRVFDKVFH